MRIAMMFAGWLNLGLGAILVLAGDKALGTAHCAMGVGCFAYAEALK